MKEIYKYSDHLSQKTAEHHLIHLKEYIALNHLDISITGVENFSEMHSIAFLVVDESEMKPIRDALKPHRGQVYTED